MVRTMYPLPIKYLFVIDSGSNLVKALNYLKSMQNLFVPSFSPTSTTDALKAAFDGYTNHISITSLCFVLTSFLFEWGIGY